MPFSNEQVNNSELGRLWKEKQEETVKQSSSATRRPPLSSLTTGGEVRRWIPRIRAEITWCLRQVGSRRYSDAKIEEFKQRLDQSRRAYKAFIKRALELDPYTNFQPGRKHGYVSKRQAAEIKKRKLETKALNPSGWNRLYGSSWFDKQQQPEHLLQETEKSEEPPEENIEELDDDYELTEDDLKLLEEYDKQFPDPPDPNVIPTPLATNRFVKESNSALENSLISYPPNQPLQFGAPNKKQKLEASESLNSLLDYGSGDEDT